MAQITIEQLIDIVQAELTVSGLFPKTLPDAEIYRLIKEHALEWFYKNYYFSKIKSYYYMKRDCFKTEQYTKFKYFILPDEVESITRMVKIDDPSLFQLGIQAPHLSINLGVTNQPFLTSFVTTAGDLGVYRSVISAFSDELNKMNKQTLKFDYNHHDHRLNILTNVDTDLVLEVYLRIEQEDLFDAQIFKDYVIGLSKVRLGEVLGRFSFNMPGNFQYQASDVISQGEKMIESVKEKVKGETQAGWFIMSR
jgi:hypothetical protein